MQYLYRIGSRSNSGQRCNGLQCDQIVQFLKSPGHIFSLKSSQNLWWLFGLKRKASFFSGSFLGNFLFQHLVTLMVSHQIPFKSLCRVIQLISPSTCWMSRWWSHISLARLQRPIAIPTMMTTNRIAKGMWIKLRKPERAEIKNQLQFHKKLT